MNKNGELEKRIKNYVNNILNFFQRTEDLSVVNKDYSNNKQGNKVRIF
jgi:hypothetical protein